MQGHRLQAVEILTWMGEDMAQGMVAVGFLFPHGRVTIYNALDENGMEFRDPDQQYVAPEAERVVLTIYGHGLPPLDIGGGDGNRTRAISLGTSY